MQTLERKFKNKFIVTDRIKPVLTGQFTVFLHKDDFKVKELPVQDILGCIAFVISCLQSLASDPVLNALIIVIMFCYFRVLFQIHFVSRFHFLYSYVGLNSCLYKVWKGPMSEIAFVCKGPLLKKNFRICFRQIYVQFSFFLTQSGLYSVF